MKFLLQKHMELKPNILPNVRSSQLETLFLKHYIRKLKLSNILCDINHKTSIWKVCVWQSVTYYLEGLLLQRRSQFLFFKMDMKMCLSQMLPNESAQW